MTRRSAARGRGIRLDCSSRSTSTARSRPSRTSRWRHGCCLPRAPRWTRWSRRPTRSWRSCRGAASTTCARSPSTPTTRRCCWRGRTARSSGCRARARSPTTRTPPTPRCATCCTRTRWTRREHLEGVWIEPKTFGFGVHTRRADPADAEVADRAVDAIVQAEAPHWRRRTGHNIVEYAFRHEGKDSAIAELRERTDAAAVALRRRRRHRRGRAAQPRPGRPRDPRRRPARPRRRSACPTSRRWRRC